MTTEKNSVNTTQAKYQSIDHIAISVRDLEPAIEYFTGVLGFVLVRRRKVEGVTTGMLSAELEHGPIKFVLCQGTEPESQVSRLVENFGPGIAHIALRVGDVGESRDVLAARGQAFDTNIIGKVPLRQVFSSRDPNTGLSFEFIERHGAEGFLDENVHDLFSQLEKSGAY
jgi:4-hydroxyphenylpyruvate dioxygenase-like putative hemolysin